MTVYMLDSFDVARSAVSYHWRISLSSFWILCYIVPEAVRLSAKSLTVAFICWISC